MFHVNNYKYRQEHINDPQSTHMEMITNIIFMHYLLESAIAAHTGEKLYLKK